MTNQHGFDASYFAWPWWAQLLVVAFGVAVAAWTERAWLRRQWTRFRGYLA